jgi:predicted RNA binding protein YcfA (HicA-like mRNA interferase family)
VRALKAMGFVQQAQKATSHTQWTRDDATGRRKVTLDQHQVPHSRFLLKTIAVAAGVSVREFVQRAKGR